MVNKYAVVYVVLFPIALT